MKDKYLFWQACDLIPESADAVHLALCVHACGCVCVCSAVVLAVAQSVQCLTFCRCNNRGQCCEPALRREECCGGLNDLVSVRPLHAPILINEMHREGKQPCNNTECAAF